MNFSTVDVVILATTGMCAAAFLARLMNKRRAHQLAAFERELRKEKKRRAMQLEQEKRQAKADELLRSIDQSIAARKNEKTGTEEQRAA